MKKILILFFMVFGLTSVSSENSIGKENLAYAYCCTQTVVVNGEPVASGTWCTEIAGPASMALACKIVRNIALKKLQGPE